MIKLIKEFNQLNDSQQIYFLSLVEESFLLLEGIKSAKEKYLDEIGEDKFNELVEIDPSRNKKYLDWICKEYLKSTDIERLENDIKLFDEKCNKNLIENKDIYSYDNIDELESILNETPDISNTERKKEIKRNPNKEEIEILPDVKVLRNDDEYFIAEINSWEDAKFYGKGTKWCISEKGNNKYWKEYYEDDKDRFIYVRDFKYPNLGMNSDPYYKLMIQIPENDENIYDKNDIDYSDFDCNIWDAKDEVHPTNVLEISDRFRLYPEDIINARIIDLSDIDFTTKEGIEEWLNNTQIRNYTINDDLTVDVNGDVNLSDIYLRKIPVQFRKVTGDFICSYNFDLEFLYGSPIEVKSFICSNNNLKSLEGAPKIVKGDFDCSGNPNLKSLKGAPEIVKGFYCKNNPKLESLEGAPKIVKDFYCTDNPKLKSLKGAPKKVKGNFRCSYNDNLESLEGAPEKINGYFECEYNPKLESLEGAPKKINGFFDCSHNNLKSLEGAPNEIPWYFVCSHNKLESLEGAPKKINGFFDCSNNPKLKSLKGAPEEIDGYFDCSYNDNLESLKGAFYRIDGDFICSHNPKLKSLEGSPKIIVRDFICSYNNNLESLEGAPKIVKGNFICSYNSNLKSLKGISKKINENFYCQDNPKLSKEYLNNFDFSFVKGEIIL